MENAIKYFACEFYGDYALFSDPFTGISGENFTYPVPTYEALKGMLKSVYWKPTFEFVIDKVRVMNEIVTNTVGVTNFSDDYNKRGGLYRNTLLCDVRYQVLFHIEWNLNHHDLAADRNMAKHSAMLTRGIEKGGRFDIFFGKRDYQAYVVPCTFGDGEGFYDSVPEYEIGAMYHSITYPDTAYDEETRDKITVHCVNNVVMRNGIITFLRPEECPRKLSNRRTIKNGIKHYEDRSNITFEEDV